MKPPKATGPALLELKVADLELGANVRQVQVDDGIRELARSIEEHGILEPVLVAPPSSSGGRYLLVAGYRRVAAAKLAKLLVVPAIVTDRNEDLRRQVQLVENVQREGLAPTDEARALKELVDGGLTQAELARRIGKSQPYVANRLRLLTLPEDGLKLLETGKISASVAERILEIPANADRERKSVVRAIEKDLKAGPRAHVTEDSVGYAVRTAKDRFAKRQAFERLKASAKFPDCPKKGCEKPATALEDWYSSPPTKLRCSDRHAWNAKTGKLDHDWRDDQERPARPAAAPAPPAKPTLPVVDQVLDTDLSADAIARRILELAGRIDAVQVIWDGRGKGAAHVELELDLAELAKREIPGFTSRTEDGGKVGLEIQGLESWNQQDDRGRRRSAVLRKQLEDWVATIGAKPGRRAAKKGGGS